MNKIKANLIFFGIIGGFILVLVKFFLWAEAHPDEFEAMREAIAPRRVIYVK